MAKVRTHLLLEPEQQRALAQIARREGRSVSDVTREIVQQGIEQRQRLHAIEKQRRIRALQRGRQVRQAILEERGGAPLDLNISSLIEEIRQERNDQLLERGD